MTSRAIKRHNANTVGDYLISLALLRSVASARITGVMVVGLKYQGCTDGARAKQRQESDGWWQWLWEMVIAVNSGAASLLMEVLPVGFVVKQDWAKSGAESTTMHCV